MNPSLLKLVLHLGIVIKSVKDVEHGVEDAIAGKLVMSDVKAILDDLSELVVTGVIVIPGVTPDQFKTLIADIEAAV